jgi:membrane protein required for colicin V production
MEFTIFDAVVIVLIVGLGFKGLINGLIKEVFGLVGMIGGVFIASRFSTEFGIFFDQNIFKIPNEGAKNLVGFSSLFLLFWVSSILLGLMLAKMVKISGLGIMDKLLGAFVGSAKIFLIFSILAYGIGSVKFIKDMFKTQFENSITFTILYNAGSMIISFEPDEESAVGSAVKDAMELRKEVTDKVSQEVTKKVSDEIHKQVDDSLGQLQSNESPANSIEQIKEMLKAKGIDIDALDQQETEERIKKYQEMLKK